MKTRSSDAAHLERDYLDRVRAALRGQRGGEVDEIIQSLSAHIEEELAESPAPTASLVQMAQVIERLGPVESYAQGDDRAEHRDRFGAGATAAASLPSSTPPAASLATGGGAVAAKVLLGNLWWGYFLIAVGAWIPVVNIEPAALIGTVVLAFAVNGRFAGGSVDVRGIGTLAMATLAASVACVPLKIWSVTEPMLTIVEAPLTIAAWVMALLMYWRIFAAIAAALVDRGESRLASDTLRLRQHWMMINVGLCLLGWMSAIVAHRLFEHLPQLSGGIARRIGTRSACSCCRCDGSCSGTTSSGRSRRQPTLSHASGLPA